MRACRIDSNHAEIVKALKDQGASVQSLATIGKGCPDLMASTPDKMWLIEVKGPKGKLTPDQIDFIGKWKGVVHIVRTTDDVLRLMGKL